MTTETRLAFLLPLSDIASNPEVAVRKYPVINPTHEIQYSPKPVRLITGIVLCVAAYYFRSEKVVLGGLLTGSAFILFKSFSIKKVETKPYSDQALSIEMYFDPCIQGLNEAYLSKAKAIHATVNDKEMDTPQAIKAAIEAAASNYDQITKSADNESLTSSAKKLADLSVDKLPQEVDPAATRKVLALKIASRLFLYGKKRTAELGDDAYITYVLINKKAVTNFSVSSYQ